ncbi:MAG: peptidoglycan-associated lipoprotein Pal [Rhodobacteraceae bacterium]|nr:peptidoglycan-associated lipoprotein Pal [Paracoccaceae bacterium]
MRRPMMLIAAGLALVLTAACSSRDEAPASGAGANSPSNQVARAAPTPQVDAGSIEYFQVSVGDRVFFETDRSDLTPEARAVLDRQAQWLQVNPNTRVVVEGHADERGTREYNLALGARRANAVRSYLASKGVPATRMRAVSFGRERPVEICSRTECWAKNRRSVTVVDAASG